MCWQNLALLPVLDAFTSRSGIAPELQAFSVLPFQQTTDLVEKLRAQNVAFEELIIPDEIHDLLRWSRLGHFQTVTNSDLGDFRRPIPSMSKSKNVAFVLRMPRRSLVRRRVIPSTFVIRPSSLPRLPAAATVIPMRKQYSARRR